MREEQEFEIGGETYVIRQLGAIKGRKVLTRLVRALGGAIGALASGDGKVTAAVLGQAVTQAIEKIDDETMSFLCDAFGDETRIVREDGKRPVLKGPVFDDQFAGNYSAMLEWLVCCVVVNFPDFLDGAGITNLLARVATPASASQTD